MARWILIMWTYFAALASFAVGIWVATAPYGSIWVGVMLALLSGSLGTGISLYLWEESAPRRRTQYVPESASHAQQDALPRPQTAVARTKPSTPRKRLEQRKREKQKRSAPSDDDKRNVNSGEKRLHRTESVAVSV